MSLFIRRVDPCLPKNAIFLDIWDVASCRLAGKGTELQAVASSYGFHQTITTDQLVRMGRCLGAV